MKTDVPLTYNALMEVIYDIPINKHGRYRSNLVYRGMDDAEWEIISSIQRLKNNYSEIEIPLIRNFVKYSSDRNLAEQSIFYQLSVAQHHGLPTRVLGWTTSPRIALHFSVGDESKFDKDGVVWAVDVTRCAHFLPEEFKSILFENKAEVFSVDMLRNYGSIKSFSENNRKEFALFFEPPSLDSRIVNQAAMLSIMPDVKCKMENFLNSDERISRKIIVKKELKWELRDKLDQDQIHERVIFQDLMEPPDG